MRNKRAAIVLFAATTSTAIAVADPTPTTPVVQPKTLKTGAPACGNVMIKSYGPPTFSCVTAPALLTAAGQALREITETVAVINVLSPADRPALTLAEEGRPRS